MVHPQELFKRFVVLCFRSLISVAISIAVLPQSNQTVISPLWNHLYHSFLPLAERLFKFLMLRK